MSTPAEYITMGGFASTLEEQIGAAEALQNVQRKVQYEFDKNQWTFGEFRVRFNGRYNVCSGYTVTFYESTLINAIKRVSANNGYGYTISKRDDEGTQYLTVSLTPLQPLKRRHDVQTQTDF